MKVLVTGASGFLGSHVAEQLKSQGHEVRCLVRRSSKIRYLEDLGVELAFGAIEQPGSLPEAVRGVDAVVHCAGVVKARGPEEFDRVNHLGTRYLLEATAEHAPGVRRFVYVSSAGVMGPGREGVRHRVSDEPRPVTHYARSKLAGERAALEFKDRLPITILRPVAVYGPRDQEILAFFKMVNLGLVVRMGDGLKSCSMVFGPDCADACIRAIEAPVPSGSIYFVEDGDALSFGTMCDLAAEALGVQTWGRIRVPVTVLRGAAAVSETFGRLTNKAVMFTRDKVNELVMEHFVCDASDARRDLGWEPKVNFARGAKITADWYKANQWL